jgi:hypothetical protein
MQYVVPGGPGGIKVTLEDCFHIAIMCLLYRNYTAKHISFIGAYCAGMIFSSSIPAQLSTYCSTSYLNVIFETTSNCFFRLELASTVFQANCQS